MRVFLLIHILNIANALPYDAAQVDFNLNTNSTATNPLEYSGKWEGHSFHPSPRNWRVPFYTIFLDRFVNGDPTNDNANGTAYEHDLMSNQFRNGGDIKGLMDTLDYLAGMGIKGLYLAGSPHINQPWASDSYSPLDLTLLDHHFGNINAWRDAIEAIHAKGMYVILDNTMSTLGDLIGFEGYFNTTTPFSFTEHTAAWKTTRRYHDFQMDETIIERCNYPRFWSDEGERIGRNVTDQLISCKASEFDQYGDVASFGVYPEWQKQLSKFGFVQDRLREWRPSVLDKIKHFSCLTIQMLDIDGFRIDKALTITSDAQADWSEFIRKCAKNVGKTNFFLPGEIVSGNVLASVYLGRGKEPGMAVSTIEEAFNTTIGTDTNSYIRNSTKSALDAAAFHYSVYRSMCRFLGIDGVYAALEDTPVNWVDAWNSMLQTNDFVNQNTQEFDPRHMYGVTNQDVFRWPAIKNGTHKNLLGLFITTILLPGIPTLMWGEEQATYVLENTASNYVFGRAPMTSSLAWQIHGCYSVGSEKYFEFPLEAALMGCHDDSVSLDHRDPSHPVRNVLKRMHELRNIYPALNDGFSLTKLSNKTMDTYLLGSNGTATEIGIWSVMRSRSLTQNFDGHGQGNQSVWLIYSNEHEKNDLKFDCGEDEGSLLAPFDVGTTVKNLFYPYEEAILETSSKSHYHEGSINPNGCLSTLTMPAWGFKAYVPKEKWVGAAPTITRFVPGHDFRIISPLQAELKDSVPIGLYFSETMSCQSVTNSIIFESNTDDDSNPIIDANSIKCGPYSETTSQGLVGSTQSQWVWSANLVNVASGVHNIVINNATDAYGKATGAVDRFMFRIGHMNNPMVFPSLANYSTTLLHNNSDGSLYISHNAAGATLFRYSIDWNSHFSDWIPYRGGNTSLTALNWTGTRDQAWSGDHVYVQYWSNLTGSSDHFQHGDLFQSVPRRFPHLFVQGPFNQYSYDNGLPGNMVQDQYGTWEFDLMTEWPTSFQLNEWGLNPDGQPDQTMILGDVDHDGILDRIPPGSLLTNIINVTQAPPFPHTAWTILVNDGTLQWTIIPVGNCWNQLVAFVLLAIIPILTAAGTIWIFIKSFYQIKFNQKGVVNKIPNQTAIQLPLRRRVKKDPGSISHVSNQTTVITNPLQADAGAPNRRRVLIATMEYDIEDWEIKIKIGGLGVMAQLMGKNLGHQDLIWVVPCVSGVDYPMDTPVNSIFIKVLDKKYEVQVQCHVLRNITYVLLDAPIFRKQSKSEPYPARMDDLESAIYYSAWNQCIAQIIKRYDVGLYHINDYHGALAPLHLLPNVIPCCLSLHNAEFQGLWPMRTLKERDEVCSVFNIDSIIATKYVQFGEVFNLLHAGVSYLRIHQRGFGAVGVSKKYGKRSFARYPIFWGLSRIGSLPNPDPTDTGELERNATTDNQYVVANEEFESKRPALKRQAQVWAGLDPNPDAELFVFVGRWSMQKGIDLIADVFPSVLESNSKVQLICVGPIIDLYGRFAALKLEKMMKLYPGRVHSKPQFTALPPYIFSGSEFALIPSRDEPFGLVAVEFGRKGALGVGARVGGLGQMPGWWYSIESMTSKHLVQQFKMAIYEALNSSTHTRSLMRARSALQRFPVAQWVEDLDTLQTSSIKFSKDEIDPAVPRSPLTTKLRIILSGNSTAHNNQFASPSGLSQQPVNLHVPGAPEAVSGPWTPPDIKTSPLGLMPTSVSSPHDSHSRSRLTSPTSAYEDNILPPPAIFTTEGNRDSKVLNLEIRRLSTLSYDSVAGNRKDFALQKVDPSFTDATGAFSRAFERKLEMLGGKSSENLLCIEENLVKSEKEFFNMYRDAKMGFSHVCNSRAASPAPSGPQTPTGSYFDYSAHGSIASDGSDELINGTEEFVLGKDYKPPTGLKRFLLYKIGDWPIYAIYLAFGQIIAANSYQITLLIGEIGQTAEQLYIIASIYAVSSLMWWFVFRKLKSVYVLSVPFAFYGLAFFLIALAPLTKTTARGWIQNIATGIYAAASSSGSLYFALNFGDEGGAPIKSWVLRACLVQGTQQLYISALWYWGASLVTLSSTGTAVSSALVSDRMITTITCPIAIIMWTIGGSLFVGLPKYYRSSPGTVPTFYKSICRRKIILWFFVSVLIQNYWLSAPYGRNWRYLWTTQHAPAWAIALLVIAFFVGVWAAMLFMLSHLSKSHSWILPVFAIGLGAPRWCQMLWGTSAIGSYLAWAGSPVASALLGRCLWLWLGVLDALQGVGFGMILLQTMTRFHVSFTLMAAQVLGSVATILARLTAPDKTGPGDVFPNFALGGQGLGRMSFWLGMGSQILVCFGFALFFRKEQLAKP